MSGHDKDKVEPTRFRAVTKRTVAIVALLLGAIFAAGAVLAAFFVYSIQIAD